MKLWTDENFRQRFPERMEDSPPPRAILFTTNILLEQLSKSSKWSQDGTHRTAPKDFGQVFITMMKIGTKWIPAVKGLLPNHQKESYKFNNEMIKFTIEKKGRDINITSILSDFEIGIQQAASETFPGVHLKGCRFHFAQV